METINLTIKSTQDQNLKEILNHRLSEFMAIWRHIEPLETHDHNGYRDESTWSHYTIPIYTGFGIFCNPEGLEDDKRDQYYRTYHNCLVDFCQILLAEEPNAVNILHDECNISFILTLDKSSEMAVITLTDDLIHIYYITTGQW